MNTSRIQDLRIRWQLATYDRDWGRVDRIEKLLGEYRTGPAIIRMLREDAITRGWVRPVTAGKVGSCGKEEAMNKTETLELTREEMEWVVSAVLDKNTTIHNEWTKGNYASPAFGRAARILHKIRKAVPDCFPVTYSR